MSTLSNPSPYATGSGKRGSKKPILCDTVTIRKLDNSFKVDCTDQSNGMSGKYKAPKESAFPSAEEAFAFGMTQMTGAQPDDEAAETKPDNEGAEGEM
jgi:hypothetical protein